MIHKIEIYPHYTYPAAPLPSDKDLHESENISMMAAAIPPIAACDKRIDDIENLNQALPPYRTVSHYGFNYPSTYMPPVNLVPGCSMTSVDLQRQKVIAFIKRLNFEAQGAAAAAENHLNNRNPKSLQETGKEDDTNNTSHIYENTKKLQAAESFVSVKEIQLNHNMGGKNRKVSSSSSTHNKNRTHSRQSQADLMSEQFSSLLSISGTYPAASHSHTGDHEPDHDHDHYNFTTTTDSGDNCSNFDLLARKTLRENLYRSYMQSHYNTNYMPRNQDQEHDPHKPESEQQPQQQQPVPRKSSTHHKQMAQYSSSHDDRHVTLTLNSLKRRASSLSDRKEKTRSRTGPKSLQVISTKMTAGTGGGAALHSSSDSNASTAIEIHINVNIRNSDCVKNLQEHEHEFKSKLEKVIDNEIHLITQELENHDNDASAAKDVESLFPTSMNFSHRCLSAPEAIGVYNVGIGSPATDKEESACIEADRHYHYDYFNSAASTPLPPLSATLHDKSNLYSLRYRHTLAMLEHELEMLLNGIIRNMCDCKTKISQLSEEIRTATLHVGSLSTANRDKRTHCRQQHHHDHQQEHHHHVQSSPE